MRMCAEEIVIRAFLQKDAPRLYEIVREPGVVRYMADWSEGFAAPEDYYPFIEWQRSVQDDRNMTHNRRYAIALKETDELIGMVGLGEEDTLNEVEIAYFMTERYQRRGFAQAAVNTLAEWCFSVSGLPYLIATIDCANKASVGLAQKCGFELFEERTPIGHAQPNMRSGSYYYLRRYR